jgi:hypothetical protein
MQRSDVLKEAANDLSFFGKIISPQTYYLPTPEFHSEVDELLMDDSIIQLLIEAPRGTAKSTKCTQKVLHHGIYDEGDKFVVIQSYTRPEAINRLTKIKNVIEYDKNFRELYGYCGEQVAEVWREDKIKTTIGGHKFTVKALGTGQPVRGSLEEDTRITLYLLDDPDNEESCLTKEQMEKNFDKVLGGIAGLDRRNGRVIVIGTPIREGCIVERLRNASGWVTRRYQSYNPETKETLWKEMYSYEWLMNKKKEFEELGKLSKFYSEYMCEIVGDEDRLFKKEYLRWYDGCLIFKEGFPYLKMTHEGETEYDIRELTEARLIPVNTFLGVDPASSTKSSADYSVTFPVLYDGIYIYADDYFRKRVAPTAHAEQIIDKIKTIQPTRAFTESVGYQEMLRDYLRKRLAEENLFVSGLETKITPRTEKSARLERLHPMFFNRRVYVKKNMTEFVDELMMYPRARHDDLMDGFDLATRKLVKPDHTIEKKEVEHFKPLIRKVNTHSNEYLWMN